jgi:hypothetical protein
MTTGNRKERRAATKTSTKSNGKTTGASFTASNQIDENGVNMILQHPDRSGPKGKSLFDLAEERQRELDKINGRTRVPIPTSEEEEASAEDSVGAFGDAILYAISMGALHFTFDVIVYSQYREEVIWPEIFKRAASALPIFFLLVYLLHVDFSKRFPLLRNLFFLAVSVTAGCYMIYSANMHGYFYVMKAAPPIGALWIWSVVEMDLLYAAPSCALVFGYLWWNGFEAF